MTAREELHRGWPVILGAFFGVMTGVLSLPFMLLGPLIRPMRAELGWSENAIAGVATVLGVGLILATPLTGWLVDRFRPRPLGLASLLLLIVLLVAASQTGENIAWLYAVYFLMGLLCGGSGYATYTRALGYWFDKARGLALGLALSGTGIAALLIPNIVASIDQHFGWRAVFLGFALMMLASMPLIAWGVKDAPGGEASTASEAATPKAARASGFWLDMARDVRFALLATTLAILGLAISGTILRLVPMLVEHGFSATRAAALASLIGITMLVGRIGFGWLADHFPATVLTALCCASAAIGSLAFAFGGAPFAIATVLSIGLLWGCVHNLLSLIVIRFFGLERYGTIFSALYSIYVLAGLFSPMGMGLVKDIGGYELMFIVNGAVFAAAAAGALILEGVARAGRYQASA